MPNAGSNRDSLSRVVSPICEILWRCSLVTGTDQEYPVLLMHNDVGYSAENWRAEFIDIEDSRKIVDAFNRRLERTGIYAYAPINPSAIPMLLIFMTPYVKHGARDLLSSLFGSIIRHMWDWLVEKPEQANRLFVDAVRNTLSGFP